MAGSLTDDLVRALEARAKLSSQPWISVHLASLSACIHHFGEPAINATIAYAFVAGATADNFGTTKAAALLGAGCSAINETRRS